MKYTDAGINTGDNFFFLVYIYVRKICEIYHTKSLDFPPYVDERQGNVSFFFSTGSLTVQHTYFLTFRLPHSSLTERLQPKTIT